MRYVISGLAFILFAASCNLADSNKSEIELTPPTLEAPINGAIDMGTSLTLSWNPIQGASDYKVQLSTEQSFSTLVFENQTEDVSQTVTDLTPETQYFWRVRPVNNAVEGPWSDVRNFLTTSAEVVIPPSLTGDINVYAYLATWDYNVGGHGNWGSISQSEVDWDSFTHGILFASGVGQCSIPEPAAWENLSPDRINAFVNDANANGKAAMISFGGAGNSDGLFYSIENCPEQLAQLMSDFMVRWGFHGIDIDAEPTGNVDRQGLATFAQRFRELQPNAVLVAAINGGESQMAAASEYFDAINYMTYDLSGAWGGWYSWHNAAIYNPSGGTERVNIPGSNTEYPNIHSIVEEVIGEGTPRGKAGFGVSVDGYVWTGVNAPEQNASGANRTYAPRDITVLTNDYGTNWIMDENAGVSYLSGSNTFVSVDNAASIANKFEYARDNDIKHIIWWKYTEYQPVIDEFKRQLGN